MIWRNKKGTQKDIYDFGAAQRGVYARYGRFERRPSEAIRLAEASKLEWLNLGSYIDAQNQIRQTVSTTAVTARCTI